MMPFQRIIFSDNGTLIDVSSSLNNYQSDSYVIPFVAAQDYLYIGSELPFNHRHFDISVANANNSAIEIRLWDGDSWELAVDINDMTSVSNKSFAQSGIISWSKDRFKSWSIEDSTEDITGLSTLKIYKMYWLRLGFSSDLTSTTALNYIGHKFCNDTDFDIDYPDLNISATKTAFKSGKTNWNEQHYRAAEEIILFLRRKRELWSANQIFDWMQFNIPSMHKSAEIIMSAFGDDFKDNVELAKKRFSETINQYAFRLDKNEDGELDECELRHDVRLYRG